MNRIVALDVDGVLADFDAHWRQCAEQVLGRSVPRVSISVDGKMLSHPKRGRHPVGRAATSSGLEFLRRHHQIAMARPTRRVF
jgi:hypothetical protein